MTRKVPTPVPSGTIKPPPPPAPPARRDVSPDLVKRALRVQYGASEEDAQRAIDRMGLSTDGAPVRKGQRGADVSPKYRTARCGAGVISFYERKDDALRMTINLPPRTKKNGTTLGIRQSVAYRAYRDAIIDGVAWVNSQHSNAPLSLPHRDAGYNIAAVYYVDSKGRAADKVGLDQGLYDALENAGVIPNDWLFRCADGTRILFDDPNPRVEIHITPIAP